MLAEFIGKTKFIREKKGETEETIGPLLCYNCFD